MERRERFSFFLITLIQWTCGHICIKRRKQEEGKKGAGYSCTTIKTAHVFCFLHVFSFPKHAQTFQSHRKEAEKNISISSSKMRNKEVCVGHGNPPPHPSIQSKASCSVCLVLFVCVSSNSLGSPCMEGRKKDSSLTAFDVHVLWPHVNALSVKSFCCPSA